MIYDDENTFNDQQAVTATGVSDDTLDLSADRNIGIGKSMSVAIFIDVSALVSDTDETYAFAVEADDNSSFSSAVTVVSRSFTNAEAAAELVSGGQPIILPLPADLRTEQHLRVAHTLAGTTPGITYTAILVPTDALHNEVKGGYPSGSSIS